jgi:hypothetical protein
MILRSTRELTKVMKVLFRLPFAAAVLLSATLVAGSASARGVVIDQSGSWQGPYDFCTVGGSACDATTIPFSIDVGNGLTNKVYLYSDGLVSIGAPLVAPAGGLPDLATCSPNCLSAFTDQDVFSPYYFPAAGQHFVVPSTGLDIAWGVDDGFSGQPIEFSILPASGNPGAFTLSYYYGNDMFGPPTTLAGDEGYSFGENVSESALIPSPVEIDQTFDLGSVSTSAAPEPAAWALMLVGLGFLGAVLRRRASPVSRFA